MHQRQLKLKLKSSLNIKYLLKHKMRMIGFLVLLNQRSLLRH